MSQVDGLAAPERRRAMFCVMLGLALSNLSNAVVNIALPDVSHSFGTSDAATVWTVNAYQLAATVCLLPVAAMGETLGLKRVYTAGLVIFTAASLACALSPTLAALVCARLVQGAGAACISVAGVALVRVIHPRSLISRALALVALAVSVPAALGPTVAAMILAVARWPWLFLLNVPLGGLALLLFLEVAPPGVRVARPFDLTGAVLNALAFGLLAVGVGALGVGNSGLGLAEMIGGLICFGLLFRQQVRHPAPMVPFDLLRIPVFVLSMGTSICSYTAQILAYVSLPFMFERGLHLTPVATGLLVAPWPLMTAAAAPIAGRLTNRYPASTLSAVGLLILAAGLLLMVFLPAAPANWDIVWRLALCGIGFGLFQTPNNTSMMMAGPVNRSGAAASMNAVARYVGLTLGSALVAVIFGLGGARAAAFCLEAGASFSLIGALASSARRLSSQAHT
ncbi:MAG: MFS transporter [Hyphomicrobiales bacterium]|nr:MFS transporter [Hyphomicrobiales bacterium]